MGEGKEMVVCDWSGEELEDDDTVEAVMMCTMIADGLRKKEMVLDVRIDGTW